MARRPGAWATRFTLRASMAPRKRLSRDNPRKSSRPLGESPSTSRVTRPSRVSASPARENTASRMRSSASFSKSERWVHTSICLTITDLSVTASTEARHSQATRAINPAVTSMPTPGRNHSAAAGTGARRPS